MVISDDMILKGQSICSVSNRTDYKSSGLAVAVGSMRMLSVQPWGDTVRQLSLKRAVRELCLRAVQASDSQVAGTPSR